MEEFLSVSKRDALFLHYYYLVGSHRYTYTCPCQVMLCKGICDTVTFIKFYINSYISKHIIIDLPVLLYGSETWTNKARDARRITAAEMKYMRRTAGYIWTYYKTSAQIAKELKITPILDKLLEYKRKWIQHVNRMPRNR